MDALGYLQTDIADCVDHGQPDEEQRFQLLAGQVRIMMIMTTMMMIMMVRAGVPAAVLHVPGRHRPPPAAVAPVRHAGQLLPRRDDPAEGQPRRPHSPSAAAAADQAVNGTRAVAVTHDRVVTQVENSDHIRCTNNTSIVPPPPLPSGEVSPQSPVQW